MRELLTNVLPAMLGSAISPTVLALALVVLSGKAHQRARGVAYVAGAAAVLVVIGAAGLVAFGQAVGSTEQDHGRASAIVSIVFGVLLLGFGVFRLFRPARARPPKPETDEDARAPRLGRFFAIGAAIMATNATTLVLYLAELKEIARADVSGGARVATLAVGIAIALAPATVPLGLYALSPVRGARLLGRFNDFLRRHTQAVAVTICLGFGVYLTLKGLRAL